MSEPVVIVSAVRTAIGKFMGGLSNLEGPKLGSAVIAETLKRSGVSADQVQEVIMGCVLTGGMGQAPARQAAKHAGLPNSVRCATINKVCGSGLKSVGLAEASIALGASEMVVAGGMESMSRAPFALPEARKGLRLGHSKVLDLMIHDGLWDPYNDFHMGHAAELCAKEFRYTREAQDAFAVESYKRANRAIEQGKFKREIVPIHVELNKQPTQIETDEEPGQVNYAKIPSLKPTFQPNDGTVTAANASTLNDGAAAVLLMKESSARQRGLKPLARILGFSEHAQAPEWFTTAPIACIQTLLKNLNLKSSDIDLYEINEAFSVVAMAAIQQLNLSPSQVNVYGGAVALGHPIGASGCRLLVTLIHALLQENKQRGVASLCIGGGEAIAVCVELVRA